MNLKSPCYVLLPVCGLFAFSSVAQAQSFLVTANCSASSGVYLGPADSHSDMHNDPIAASAMTQSSVYDPIDTTYPLVAASDSAVQGQQGLITGSLHASTAEATFAMAESQLNWTDTLTVTSTTLAPGTPVSLLILARYQASVSNSTYNPIENGIPTAATSLNFQSLATDTSFGTSAPLNFMATDRGEAAYDMPVMETLSARVGDTIMLTSSVDMQAMGSFGGFGGFKVHTDSSIDRFASALFLDAPDGVSVLSASGHSYAATPAPGSLSVLLAGVFAIGTVRGLRKRLA